MTVAVRYKPNTSRTKKNPKLFRHRGNILDEPETVSCEMDMSDQWAVGMGCRTNGLSEQRAVTPGTFTSIGFC